MARIHGVTSGLNASPLPRRKVKEIPKDDPSFCSICGGRFEATRKRGIDRLSSFETETGHCNHCQKFFGIDYAGVGGVTNQSPDQAKKTIQRLIEDGWGIVLKSTTVTDGSVTLEVEMGDIFKVEKAGIEPSEHLELCSKERTLEMFGIYVMVGPCRLKLWPHEISGISFQTIMDLKRRGEVDESYVAAEDDHGHFKPSKETREQIEEMFGNWWERQR